MSCQCSLLWKVYMWYFQGWIGRNWQKLTWVLKAHGNKGRNWQNCCQDLSWQRVCSICLPHSQADLNDKINFLGKLLHMIHLPVIDLLGGTLPKDPCTPKQSSQYFLLMTAVTYHPICKNAPGKCLHVDIISCTFIYIAVATQMLLLPVSPWA